MAALSSPSATLAKPPPLRLIGEEDTEPPSPTFYFEGSPCVDRFERDLKLAQLNRDQRIEIRLMMELSTSSLQDMLGLSAEEMNEVQDEGSVDELEAAAATLRRDPGKSHQYDEDLGTYRVSSRQEGVPAASGATLLAPLADCPPGFHACHGSEGPAQPAPPVLTLLLVAGRGPHTRPRSLRAKHCKDLSRSTGATSSSTHRRMSSATSTR